MQSQNWQNDLCFQGNPFNNTAIQVYSLTSNAEEAEIEQFYGGSEVKASACNAGDPGSILGSGRSPGKGNATHSSILACRIPWTEEPGRLQSRRLKRVGHNWATSRSLSWRPTRPSRTNTPKWCPIHYMWLECKRRKSRDTWSNRQIWRWSTKRSRSKANRVLPRECTGHSKHAVPTTQEKTLHMDITRWSIPKSDWWYFLQPKMQKLYTISKNKTGSWPWLSSWTPYFKIQT